MKEEKEERGRLAREVTKRDGAMISDRLWLPGKASYVERNQDMVNASDYCVFYYSPEYQPPKRKYSKRDISEYQPKSGTKVAFDYANQRKPGGKDLTIINLCENIDRKIVKNSVNTYWENCFRWIRYCIFFYIGWGLKK